MPHVSWALQAAADSVNPGDRLQRQDASASGLFVRSPLLAKVMTILCEVTTACGILHPESLARHNVLQCIMQSWEISLECACAWSLAGVGAHKDHPTAPTSRADTEKEGLGQPRHATTTPPANHHADAGNGGGSVDVPVPPPNSLVKRTATPCSTTPVAAAPPPQENDEGDGMQDNLMSRESAELESTIKGMLHTITHQPLASSTQIPSSTCIAGVTLLQDATTSSDDRPDDQDRDEDLVPQQQPSAETTPPKEANPQRQLVVLATTPLEHLHVFALAVDALRQTVLQHLLAQYCRMSVVGSRDASLGPVLEWLNDHHHHAAAHIQQLPSSSSNGGGGIPFRHWMDLAVAGDPTVAAFRLLARCVAIEVMVQDEAAPSSNGEGGLFNDDDEGDFQEGNAAPISSPRFHAAQHGRRVPGTQPTDHETPARCVVYASLTIAPRPVAPCHHIEPCFGNQQFIFAVGKQRHHDPQRYDDPDNDDGEEEEADPSVGMLTALSHGCSRRDGFYGRDGEGGGDGMPLAITAGTLLEHQLPEDDRNAKPWRWEVPSSSPLAAHSTLLAIAANDVVAGGHAEQEFMYREHFPDMRTDKAESPRDGTTPEAAQRPADDNEDAVRHSVNVGRAQRKQQQGGPRAGDAMFLLELRSRLEFWVRRGSKPRDYDADFIALARHEQHQHAAAASCLSPDDDLHGLRSQHCDSLPSPSASKGRTNERASTTHAASGGAQHLVWDVMELPLKCFSCTIGSVRVVMSVSSSTVVGPVGSAATTPPAGGGGSGGGNDNGARIPENGGGGGGGVLSKTHELRQKLHSVSQCMRGCVFSIVDADSPPSTMPPSAAAAGCVSSSATADANGVNVSLVVCLSNGPAAVAPAFDDDDDNETAQCNVELRKLQHRLVTQHRWRGILWNEGVGSAKASLVCHRMDIDALEADDPIHCGCVRETVAAAVAAGMDGGHRVGCSSATTTSTVFRVRLKPYVAPLWWFLHRHYLLLVDLDRTIVDNAIKPKTAERRRRQAEEVQTTCVSWLVPSTNHAGSATSFSNAAGGGGVGPCTLRAKTEQIFLRPHAVEYLHTMVHEWNCTAALATKSSYARAEAILRSLADTEGSVFGTTTPSGLNSDCVGSPPPHLYRIFAAEDLVPLQQTRSPLTPSGGCGRWSDALLRARKSAEVIVSSGKCGDHVTQHLLSLRYAILDDTPLVWEEADWSHIVPVDPFTLTHVDGRRYWDSDGGVVAHRVLQRLLFGTRRKRKRSTAAGLDDNDDPSTPEDDEDAWWHAMVPAATVGSDECGATPAAAIVEEEGDDEDGGDVSIFSGHDGRSHPWWDDPTMDAPSTLGSNGATKPLWSDNPNVEDVIPL